MHAKPCDEFVTYCCMCLRHLNAILGPRPSLACKTRKTRHQRSTLKCHFALCVSSFIFRPATRILLPLPPSRVVVFVDEDNGDVDNIPSDGEGLDGDDETSDESEADSSSDVSRRTCARSAPMESGTTAVTSEYGRLGHCHFLGAPTYCCGQEIDDCHGSADDTGLTVCALRRFETLEMF